ncbi:MAG: hypothetical protein K8T25_18820 [Planctomycetia bacterium]|nr:hypothetical protein [Planctomycetia bacterium]
MSCKAPSWRRLLAQIHRDETGAVSMETVLLIGVIALPILIFLYKWGWPAIKNYFIEKAGETGITVQPGN